MTMNLTQTSPKDNREFIATDTDPGGRRRLREDLRRRLRERRGQRQRQARRLAAAGTPVDARARLKALIDSAKTSLDVEVQSLSDDTLVDAIVLAHQASVAVRVVLSGATPSTPSGDASRSRSSRRPACR